MTESVYLKKGDVVYGDYLQGVVIRVAKDRSWVDVYFTSGGGMWSKRMKYDALRPRVTKTYWVMDKEET